MCVSVQVLNVYILYENVLQTSINLHCSSKTLLTVIIQFINFNKITFLYFAFFSVSYVLFEIPFLFSFVVRRMLSSCLVLSALLIFLFNMIHRTWFNVLTSTFRSIFFLIQKRYQSRGRKLTKGGCFRMKWVYK